MAAEAKQYREGLKKILQGDIDLENDDLEVALCGTSYSPDVEDTSLSDEVSDSGYSRQDVSGVSLDWEDGDTWELSFDPVEFEFEGKARYAVLIHDSSGTLLSYLDAGEEKESEGPGSKHIVNDDGGWKLQFKLN